MKAYLSHASALDYWRTVYPEGTMRPCSVAARLQPAQPLLSSDIVRMEAKVSGITHPLHVITKARSERHNYSSVVSHVFSGELPNRSFARIDDELYVSSPDLCLVQMAEMLTLVSLIKLMYEFCGCYTLNPDADGGFIERLPLTNLKKLQAFIDVAVGLYGKKLAARSSRFVIENSASPMETNLAMILSLPVRLGGYGLESPMLNYRIDFDDEERRVTSRNYCVCDLCWPKHNLAVEYDSDLFHTGGDRIAKDSRRRNALSYHGISVVTVTRAQIMSASETEKIARTIARHTKRRIQRNAFDYSPKRAALRKELLQW